MASKVIEYDILGIISHMPIACASWHSFSDFVYLSGNMCVILETTHNAVDVYTFTKKFKELFDNFLTDAANIVVANKIYTQQFKTRTLTMQYDSNSDLYLLYITENIKKELDILDLLPIYVWKRDNNLQLTYCNKKYAEALDMNVENVIKTNAKMHLTSNTGGHSLEQLAIATGKMQTARQHVVIGGVRKLLEFKELPFNSKIGQFGYAIDVTKEEEISSNFAIYKKQTEETFDSISVAIAIFDIKTRLIFVNHAMKNMFGLDDSFVSSMPTCVEVLDWMINENKIMEVPDYNAMKQKLLDYFVNLVDAQHKIIHTPNGKSINVIIWPNFSGGLIFVFEDISDKIDVERRYNSLISAQKETLEHLKDGVVIFNQDNKIRLINNAVSEIFQFNDCEKFIGNHISDFITQCAQQTDNSNATLIVSRLINASLQRTENSGAFHLKNGKIVNYNYFPLPDGTNFVHFIDCTNSVKLNDLQNRNEQMIHDIEQMKNNFIDNITLELTAPINAIKIFIKILQMQYVGALSVKQIDYLRLITEALQKLSSIIDLMLLLGKISDRNFYTKYTLHNIVNIINECISNKMELIHDKNLNIIFETQKEISAYFDFDLIKFVIELLVNRAIFESKNGKNIRINVDFSQHEQNYVEIKFAWAGIGFTEQDIREIKAICASGNTTNLRYLENLYMMFITKVIIMHNGSVSVAPLDDYETEIKIMLPISI